MTIVWISTASKLLACHSLANACHNGDAGDAIYQRCSGCERCKADGRCSRMAGKPSHVIVMSRNGKKRAVRLP